MLEESTLNEEETPLLAPSPPDPQRPKAASLIIPIALLGRLAILLPSTTNFHVFRQFICRQWYFANDPDRVPPDGRMPQELCMLPSIQRNYATLLVAMGTLDGIASMAAYPSLGVFASRFGRKPAILAVLTAGLICEVAMILSNSFDFKYELPFLAVWLITAALSQVPIVVFVTNMYLVDLVSADTRTAALSALWGWASLGGALSFTIGGTITTHSNNVLPVYFVSAAIWDAALLYMAFVVPESFTRAKRDELRRQRENQARETALVNPEATRLRAIASKLTAILEPLQQLKSWRDPITGKNNYRLLYCAIHIFFAEIGGHYALSTLLIILTALFDYTPQDVGYFLTTLNLSNVFILTVIIPIIVKAFRPHYERGRPEVEVDTQVVTAATDHLNVHLVIVSWIIEAFAYIFLSYMKTKTTQLAAVILVGCSAGRAPVLRSLVVASVHPLKQGETLAAIEMVGSVGTFISPLVLGSILTATISSWPQLVFCVQAIIVISAALFLFLVREGDRYQGEVPPTTPL
ncbi:MFS general substrate transporter [Mycena rebaudengoi]|nr:MFS general substrate transporter [Mycena rebaudengoi]